MDKLNFSSVFEDISKELEEFIFSKAKIGIPTILQAIHKSKKIFNEELDGNLEVLQLKPVEKVKVELKTIEKETHKPETDSFEYSHSEEVEKMEISVTISDTLRDRFPRYSAASISITETPCKEFKKSFIEYNEFVEFPRVLNQQISPNKPAEVTPIDSPKQSLFSIQEVKGILNHSSEKLQKMSPGDKAAMEKAKKTTTVPKISSFDEELKKTLNSELTTSSEINKSKLSCEGKNLSCQCTSCFIM